jgi:hypothetical protein
LFFRHGLQIKQKQQTTQRLQPSKGKETPVRTSLKSSFCFLPFTHSLFSFFRLESKELLETRFRQELSPYLIPDLLPLVVEYVAGLISSDVTAAVFFC